MFHHRYDLSIPCNISIYAICSGQVFLLQIVLSLIKKQFIITLISCLLYVTTMIYWNKPYKIGFIRNLDITMVWSSCASISYYIYYYIPVEYHYYCMIHFGIVMCWHTINEILYYFQVSVPIYLPIKNDIKNDIKNVYTDNLYTPIKRYFSLEYTFMHTAEREYAYKRSMLTHCLFVHIWMTLSIFYYALFYGK